MATAGSGSQNGRSPLSALTVSQIAHYYRIDERAAKAQDLLCEPVQQYIERLNGDYRGDLVRFNLRQYCANTVLRPATSG